MSKTENGGSGHTGCAACDATGFIVISWHRETWDEPRCPRAVEICGHCEGFGWIDEDPGYDEDAPWLELDAVPVGWSTPWETEVTR